MNNTDPNTRAYHGDDLEGVIAVWQKANALAHPFLDPDFVTEVQQAMRNIYLPNAETYLVQQAGTVIGFIALLGTEIGGLFVDPRHHGQGFGKMLVDHAVRLKGPLCVDVFCDNKIGRPFYERYGFEFVSDEMHDASGHMIQRMAMPGA